MDLTQLVPVIISFLSGPVIAPIAEWIKSKIPEGSPLKTLGVVSILNACVVVILMLSFGLELNLLNILSLAFGTSSTAQLSHVIKKNVAEKE